MAAGELRVTGKISLKQFWPVGSSDADTTKIEVAVTANSFRFRPHPGAPFKVTHAFDNAMVVGKTTKAAITRPAVGGSFITVRLQGIDAPELHYRPGAEVRKADRTAEQDAKYLELNEEYRQPLAETSTVELAALLARAGQDPLPCEVVTYVDKPEEVFDTYARFVGDLVVSISGNDVTVNRWLAEEGWAFPAFYNSMSEFEITTLRTAGDAAWSAGRGIWPHLADYVGSLDFDILYRRPSQNPVHSAQTDTGLVVVPKLFRRLSTWEVNRKAKMVTGSFRKYLESKASSDSVFITDEFLAEPTAAVVRYLHEFVESDGYVDVWPEGLVFREKPSTVKGPGGAAVTW